MSLERNIYITDFSAIEKLLTQLTRLRVENLHLKFDLIQHEIDKDLVKALKNIDSKYFSYDKRII